MRGAYFYVPSITEINDMIKQVQYDIAIVGGGVGGLFSGMRLKRNDPNLRVAVFESSNHVGGRLVSIPAPETQNVITEFGGMRFPDTFHYTNKVVNKLNLEKIPFPVDEAKSPFYVRGEIGKYEQLLRPRYVKDIFNMPNISDQNMTKGLFIALLSHLGWERDPPTNALGRKN